jgi:hypothetical protein
MLRITAPHFCAAIVQGGMCAPILQWMRQRRMTLRQIEEYCARKGWTVERIDDNAQPTEEP